MLSDVEEPQMSEPISSEEKAEILTRYKYDDFHTIDWPRDLARDRMRHKYVDSRKESPLGMLYALWDAGSGWVCVLLVGLAAGTIAGVIDISARWMSDLKDGICADRFWLDREHCCWSANDSAFKENDCASWTTWPEMLHYYDKDAFYNTVGLLFYVGWSVLMAGTAACLVRTFAPYACGSGIPEIKCILSGFVIRGYLGKWTFVIKSVGLILSSASVWEKKVRWFIWRVVLEISCRMYFRNMVSTRQKKREILSASAAAGVSVAFGAPIGGIMFSLEEASYYFPLKTMWRSFFCALVAGVILRMVNPFGSDQVLESRNSLLEYLLDIIVSCRLQHEVVIFRVDSFCNFGANVKWCLFRKTNRFLGQNPIREVLIVAAGTAFLSYFNPYTRKSASALIKQLFDRCGPEDYMLDLCDYRNKSFTADKVDDNYHTGIMGFGVQTAFWQLILALMAKLIFTIFTFGVKIPSAMGAIAGRLLGIQVESFISTLQQAGGENSYWTCQIGKDCVMPGLYAMVGAAAVLGGVTRMTVSLVVIMFELTGSLEFIVPTMAGVMFAKWVGDAICKEGIYDAHIVMNKMPFLDNKGEYPYSTAASHVMRTGEGSGGLKVVFNGLVTVGELEALLRESTYSGFPVVAGPDNMLVIGFCTRKDLESALRSARKTHAYVTTSSPVYFTTNSPDMATGSSSTPLRLRRVIDLAPITVTDQTPMETVIDMFRKLGLRQVLVVKEGKLQGIITKKDVLAFMRDAEF
ncbi:Chloride channel protein [Aphelenchoides besseyi]|nr:Chloride channel protein [Aphelenchoides besseyi]